MLESQGFAPRSQVGRMRFYQRTQPWLGTLVSVGIRGVSATRAEGAMARAFQSVQRVHRLMSFHEPDSDVTRINRAEPGVAVAIAPETYIVLSRAQQLAQDSAGVFDITVATHLVRAGRLPAPSAKVAPPVGASWQDLELLPDSRVRLHRPLWIDLGGIAKGYAVDLALDAMALPSQASVRINAGGDLRVAGPECEAVWLDTPDQSADTRTLIELRDASLASSSCISAERVHLDGRSGDWSAVDRYVSVLCSQCIMADALTKVVLAQGESATPLLSRYAACAYVWSPETGWSECRGA
jgi:thiamine biosynthesis lipoprotein